jgi:WD40 repeat protein
MFFVFLNPEYRVVPQTTCEGFPKLQINPNGMRLTTLSTTSIVEQPVSYKPMNSSIQRSHDPSFVQYKDYATSSNGSYHAILARTAASDFALYVFGTANVLQADAVIKIKDLYPNISPLCNHLTEIENVKWSPDTKYVAVGFSRGDLIVIDWRKHQSVCDVFQDVVVDSKLSRPGAYDFDSRSQHCSMFVAANDMIVYRINADDKKILCCSDDLGSFVDCLTYSYDQHCVVVSLFNLKLKILDGDELCSLFEIDLAVTCPHFEDISVKLGSAAPNVTCLSLTATGEQVAIACWDKTIRILQLPKVFNLQYLCKVAILSTVQPSEMKKLPLPHLLKDYLYSLPYNP